MKDYKVIDLMYTPEEGQDTYVGTLNECEEFIKENGSMLFQIVPLTLDEIKIHNNE